jgi:hypothetical protein
VQDPTDGYGRRRGGTTLPVIAHMVCQQCGTHSEGPVPTNGSAATRCRCGGARQVVRIVRHPRGRAAASLDDLERSVQRRADDESLTRTDECD